MNYSDDEVTKLEIMYSSASNDSIAGVQDITFEGGVLYWVTSDANKKGYLYQGGYLNSLTEGDDPRRLFDIEFSFEAIIAYKQFLYFTTHSNVIKRYEFGAINDYVTDLIDATSLAISNGHLYVQDGTKVIAVRESEDGAVSHQLVKDVSGLVAIFSTKNAYLVLVSMASLALSCALFI